MSREIGLDSALELLEQCVFLKRRLWLKENFTGTTGGKDPVTEGYHWFYEKYLHVSLPQDGELVLSTPERLVARWRNPCPTLEACQKLGLDTRVVCFKAYHRPVQDFLSTIHTGLRFERNYDCIRPKADFCEEIILLDKSGSNGTLG